MSGGATTRYFETLDVLDYRILEFQGPTGPFILAPAEGSVWRTAGLALLAGNSNYSNLEVLFEIKIKSLLTPAIKRILK